MYYDDLWWYCNSPTAFHITPFIRSIFSVINDQAKSLYVRIYVKCLYIYRYRYVCSIYRNKDYQINQNVGKLCIILYMFGWPILYTLLLLCAYIYAKRCQNDVIAERIDFTVWVHLSKTAHHHQRQLIHKIIEQHQIIQNNKKY